MKDLLNLSRQKLHTHPIIISPDVDSFEKPSWRHFIIDSYHLRLIEMVDSIDSLAFMRLDSRLLKYLTDKVKIMNDNILVITHQEIADDINTSRVVVSRLLKQLENEGKIKIRRNRIIVDNI